MPLGDDMPLRSLRLKFHSLPQEKTTVVKEEDKDRIKTLFESEDKAKVRKGGCWLPAAGCSSTACARCEVCIKPACRSCAAL